MLLGISIVMSILGIFAQVSWKEMPCYTSCVTIEIYIMPEVW